MTGAEYCMECNEEVKLNHENKSYYCENCNNEYGYSNCKECGIMIPEKSIMELCKSCYKKITM
ncbi:hypothetical protein KSI01_09160 [Kurthia sibirica]|uniref:Uncharacterized protein n=1 Tax=Kurthia sibirica TaxID=202750 RepID=A0A2U3ANN8_9BACL|nr:hypothetical protein DEX24_04155 [Kurthia sibirica]GEK33383.1 hypothetical protein KSI01_09160 [Kurthia sibirica]